MAKNTPAVDNMALAVRCLELQAVIADYEVGVEQLSAAINQSDDDDDTVRFEQIAELRVALAAAHAEQKDCSDKMTAPPSLEDAVVAHELAQG